MAGGAGARLWPLSREQFPKQLLNLVAEDTLLEATARRFDGVAVLASRPAGIEPPQLVVCGEEHRFMIADMMKRAGKPARLLTEPCGRNTAPALTVAALHAVAATGDGGNGGDGSDVVLVVTPADRSVTDLPAFRQALATAVRHADAGAIVTLGVVPVSPETGYGYIRAGGAAVDGAYTLEKFVEKPHLELARHYVDAGGYWWNSGIFVVRAAVWLRAVSQLQPEMYMQCRAAYEAGEAGGDTFKLNREAFGACQSDSIDYAVMEKLESLPERARARSAARRGLVRCWLMGRDLGHRAQGCARQRRAWPRGVRWRHGMPRPLRKTG